MSTTHRRLAWIWFAVALAIAVQFLYGAPPAKPARRSGGVESTTPRGGTLPFTGSGTLPLLLTGVALLGLGVASLMAARWRYDRLNL